MSALGKLVVSLSLESAQFTKGLDKSTQETQRFSKNTQGSLVDLDKVASQAFSSMAKAVLLPVASFVSVSAALSLLSNSLDFADKINDISLANEVAVGTVLNLSQALSLNGGQAENASKLFSSLTAKLGEAADGSESAQAEFKKVGITLKDLATLDGQALFEKTLEGLTAIEDPVTRNAVAMTLLGKAVKGVDIAGLGSDFASHKKNFEDADEKFKAIGAAIDKIDEASTKLKTSIAVSIEPWYVASIDYIDKLISGYATLEENIRKANKAQAGDGKWTAAPKITDKPTFGSFSLPAEYQGGSVRDVIDTAANNASKKAQSDAESAAKEAARKAMAEHKRLNDQKLKDIQDEIDFETEQKEALNAKELKDAKELYENKIKYIDLIQSQSEKAFEEELQRQDDLKRIDTERADNINQTITDALMRGFESGESFAQNFKNTLINTFKTLVLQPVISFIVNPIGGAISAAIGGALSSGTANASTGAVSGASIFDTISKGFSSINSNFTSTIENLGTFLSTGNGGLGDAIGGYLGENASAISDGFGYLGAVYALSQGKYATAIGSAVGTYFFGPVGGAVGGAIGGLVDNWLGGSGHAETKAYANTQISSTGTKLLNSKITTGRGGGDGGYDLGIKAGLSISDSIGELTKALGGTIEKAFTLGTVYLSKYNAYSIFVGREGTRRGSDFNFNADDSSNGAAYTFFLAIKKGFIDIDPALQKIIDRSNIVLNNSLAAANALGVIQQINSALGDLPPIFKSIGDAIKSTVTVDTVADLQARFAAINTYTGLFYTDSEKMATFTKQLSTTFGGLNVALPGTRDGFRSLVDGIDTTTASGLSLFNQLIDLAPTMDSYYKALQSQADGINQVNAALAEGLDKNLFSTYADYISARANVMAGQSPLPYVGDMATRSSSGNVELLAEVKSLRAEQASNGATMKVVLEAIATYTYNSAKTLKQFNNDGLPAERTA